MMRSITFVAASALLLALPACGKDSQPAEPQNLKPDAQFTATCTELSCEFAEASTDTDGEITSWSWDFGDQSPLSTEQHPVHEYASAGEYTVKLTVTDNDDATDDTSKPVTTTVITRLTCADGSAPGGYASCKLTLSEPAGFKVVLTSSDCRAHGNIFRITEPVEETLTNDGCYEEIGKELRFDGPFPAGTDIAAEVIAPELENAPALRVEGAYPEWTLTFEDGGDADFNDLVMTLTALPE